MFKKLVVCFVTCIAFLCGCSDSEPERETLEFEAPITTFVNALNRKDESSLLGCFTTGAKEKFGESQKSLSDMLSEEIKKAAGKDAVLKCSIKDSEKLDEKAIDEISKQYTDEYSMRLDIKKAYKVTVVFTTQAIDANDTYTEPMELITVKAGGSWYIFGDVIDELNLRVVNDDN